VPPVHSEAALRTEVGIYRVQSSKAKMNTILLEDEGAMTIDVMSVLWRQEGVVL
jgi:hypothetical protein